MLKVLKTLAVTSIALAATISAANALSCLQPNFAREFNRLNAVEDIYYVGLGTMLPAGPVPSRVQNGNNFHNPQELTARYRFSGGFLRGNNVTVNRNYSVRATATCAASWCGNFPSDPSPTLIFLKVKDNGRRFSHSFGACPGGSHVNPTNRQIRAIQRCLRQGSCGPAEIAAFEQRY